MGILAPGFASNQGQEDLEARGRGETERGETGKEIWTQILGDVLRTVKEFWIQFPKEVGPVCFRAQELLRMSS